jgi:hypothetical protein
MPSPAAVNPQIDALLALQQHDSSIAALEDQLAEFTPRLAELERRRGQAADAVARAQTALDAEEKKQAYLREKVAEHKQLLEKNQAAFDGVKSLRQAQAASAQLEQIRRILADEEADVIAIGRKLAELRGIVHTSEAALRAIEADQATARGEIDAAQGAIEAQLADARAERAAAAAAVDGGMLHKYERIRVKHRRQAVYPLEGLSCSACDTAIPLQRRNLMVSGALDFCETCGVLLYMARD